VGYPKKKKNWILFISTYWAKIFVSKHTTFIKKDYVLKRRSERKTKLEEVQESQTYIQIEPELEAIILNI
jgi:hypothetical protein